MGYVEASLIKDETVTYRARLHAGIYLVPGLFSLILVGLPFLLATAARDASFELAMTNRRLIVKVGSLLTRTLKINLNKVGSVGVEQGFLGRVLNYGTITIVTGKTRQSFSGIANPFELRRLLNKTRFDAIAG